MDHAERDLGRNAEAEDQQDQRIERDLRDGVERDQDRLGDVAGEALQAEHEAEAHAERDRDDERVEEGGERRLRVRPEIRDV